MEWKDRKREDKKKKKDQWLQATAQEPEEFPLRGIKSKQLARFRRWWNFFCSEEGEGNFFFFLEANWDTNCGEGKFKKYQVFPVTPVMDGNLEGEERMEEDMVTKRES